MPFAVAALPLQGSMIAATWMTTFLAALARWGYAGVGIGVFLESAGVPVPGETVLIAAAFGAAHGVLSLPVIIAVAAVSSILGDNLGFALGRRLGRGWVERHGPRILLTPARMRRVDGFFERFGPMAVALARFVTGVRVVAAFVAGTSRMPWPVFLRYNVLGAVVWATLVSLFGYALGRGYAGAAQGMGRAGVVMAVVVPLALLAAWALRRYKHRLTESSTSPAPAEVPGVSLQSPLAAKSALQAWWSALPMRWVAVMSTSAAFVVTFAAIAEEVWERETVGFDGVVRTFLLERQSPAGHLIFTAFTWAGSSMVLGPVAVVLTLWLWQRTRHRHAAGAVLMSLVSILVMLALKAAFHRARPDGAAAYPDLGYSFPSGHSMNSMAIAVTLAYVATRERLVPAWTIIVAVLFSILVGLSRVYLDVHWATDVLGGWSIGIAIASGCALLYEWLPTRDRDRDRDRARAPVAE